MDKSKPSAEKYGSEGVRPGDTTAFSGSRHLVHAGDRSKRYIIARRVLRKRRKNQASIPVVDNVGVVVEHHIRQVSVAASRHVVEMSIFFRPMA